MPDQRELILARTHTVLSAIDGATGYRNRGDLENMARPAIILLDGDERVALNPVPNRRGADFLEAPQTMRMTPEIYVLLKEKAKQDAGLGEALNAWRIKVLNALRSDAQLKTLLGTNGGLSYLGIGTDLKNGSTIAGQLRVDVALTYRLDPTALT